MRSRPSRLFVVTALSALAALGGGATNAATRFPAPAWFEQYMRSAIEAQIPPPYSGAPQAFSVINTPADLQTGTPEDPRLRYWCGKQQAGSQICDVAAVIRMYTDEGVQPLLFEQAAAPWFDFAFRIDMTGRHGADKVHMLSSTVKTWTWDWRIGDQPPDPSPRTIAYTSPLRLGQISVGQRAACGITKSALARCWGVSASPIPAGLGRVTQISVGAGAACAIKVDRSLACWGGNMTAPSRLGPVLAVSLYGMTGCAIKSDHRPACWGANDWGVANLPSNVGLLRQVSLGGRYACGVRLDSSPICWGGNYWVGSRIPTTVKKVTAISVGLNTTCALTTASRLTCWGNPITSTGQLEAFSPTEAGLSVSQVGVDGYNITAVLANGSVWPSNGLPLVKISKLASAYGATCALTATGQPVCWGSGLSGIKDIPDA